MKTKHLLFSAFLLLIGATTYAQDNVAINASGANPDPSAMLDIASTDKGLLIPRMTESEKNGISSPVNGLMVFQTDADNGFWFYDSTIPDWVKVGASSTSSTMDFSLSVNNSSISVAAGATSAPVNLDLSFSSGTAVPVILTISGLPNNTSYSLTYMAGIPDFSTLLFVSVESTATTGSYPLVITATPIDGGAAQTVNLTLTVPSPKVVFMTSTSYNGNLGGLTGADSKCQARATAAGLPGTYVAWLSTTSVDAKDRVSNGPYALVDGTLIANNLTELTSGTLLNPINLTEFGNTFNEYTWTGTSASGVFQSPNCNNWTTASSGVSGLKGYHIYTDSRWTDNSTGSSLGTSALYCFQQ